ncbi:MAG: type II toxin-antitoxin system RelE/ParE family toxin [Spartobacteria bacterium]|nr:type II toxin-antitoxin system RelE/ParE family toxin [Spartobacteria bacterium]
MNFEYGEKLKNPCRAYPPHFKNKIIEAIHHLASNPFPPLSKKLAGREAWRIRVGDYRAIYEIHANELIVLVLDVAHRKDIYRK